MIKVYVYVTGLVLYQFSGNPSIPTQAILAAGGYTHPGLAPIPKHSIHVNTGPFGLAIPRERVAVRFEGTCPASGCTSPKGPTEIPDLEFLMAPVGGSAVLNPKCGDAETFKDECLAPGSTLSAVNGLLEFVGNWTATAYKDCSTAYPTETNTPVRINFVPAGRAWDTRFGPIESKDKNKPPMPLVLNSVLFSTTVASAPNIKSIPLLGLAESIPFGALEPAAACQGLPDLGSATHCLRLRITNGADAPEVGGADIHYAALYALLKTPPQPDDMYLPVAAEGKACDTGGGCGSFNNCVGGKAKVKP